MPEKHLDTLKGFYHLVVTKFLLQTGMFPLVVFLSCLTPRNSNNNKKPLKCAPKTQQKNNPREKENMFLVYSMLNSDLEAEGLISN